ncbi:MAG: DUF4230 domain-containing protein [Proteiniphilum sp.]|nr:DUF4230 domain-containing protein [Proteiniphilum sp.]MDD3556034.1 DUF4230 domain-containing protein [Proteiniphilum sp.]MDD3979472.1 DUF4230 domain-containing protein [Proteiniphilum sp.]MDD4485346.1 DUF4230 domain-containing protein [Proteiniphilum sp.]MDD5619182.1 DUF4230 domain-containing protein [Proteiniphilum sp.]
MEIPSKKISVSTLFFFLTTLILAILLWVNNDNREKERGYNSSSVMNRITYLQELALVKHNYTGVISYKDYMKILNLNVPLTDKYFLLKYHGYIKAGVDFNQITTQLVNDTTISVTLPKPRILETVIDENSIEVYNESDNAFNPIRITDYNEALIREKQVMVNDALKQGILDESTDQAKMVLRSLLSEMGFREIRISEQLVIPQLR